MRKILALIITLVAVAMMTMGVSAQEMDSIENLDNGTVAVRYENESGKAIKLMVEKSGERFFYDLDEDAESILPLQSGEGTYRVCVLEQKVDNRYRVALSKRIEYIAEDENECFTKPMDIIDWNEGDPIYKKALALTEGLETDNEKIMAVYSFAINAFDYDYDKINHIDGSYVPDPNAMLEEKKGICYDYSSAFAAMLRINGIPTRLVKGYNNGIDVYHAWNEVYNSETGLWMTVDTTFDAYYLDNGVDFSFEKNGWITRSNKSSKKTETETPSHKRTGRRFFLLLSAKQLSVGSGQQVQSIKTKTFRCFVLAFVLCF